jgi:hypothetical protein
MPDLSLKSELDAIRLALGFNYSPNQWLASHDKALEAIALSVDDLADKLAVLSMSHVPPPVQSSRPILSMPPKANPRQHPQSTKVNSMPDHPVHPNHQEPHPHAPTPNVPSPHVPHEPPPPKPHVPHGPKSPNT